MSSRILAGSYFSSCLGVAVLTLAFTAYVYAGGSGNGGRKCAQCSCAGAAAQQACRYRASDNQDWSSCSTDGDRCRPCTGGTDGESNSCIAY